MDLRRTFDHRALLYDKARPQYPRELFDDMIEVTGIQAGDALLEIGPGTGQATQPLAARGFHVTGIELGEHLADVARRNLSGYPNVQIINGAYETTKLPEHQFKLVYSATAFHWIEPEAKYKRTHQLLAPHGHLTIIHTNHVSDEMGDAFHVASQSIYDRYWPRGESPPPVLPRTGEVTPPTDVDQSLFRQVHFQTFPLVVRYTARQYTDLLQTYSPTLSLPLVAQQRFLGELERLINDKFGGVHEKHFAMSLAIYRGQ